LETTKEKNIEKLQVFGDSKMVIVWASEKISIQNPSMATIVRDIKLNYRAFGRLSFHHILWELNTKANELSKEALELPNGAFGYYEFMDGTGIEALEFHL
jgi:hypothetical protein